VAEASPCVTLLDLRMPMLDGVGVIDENPQGGYFGPDHHTYYV